LIGLTWYNRQLQPIVQPIFRTVRIETEPPAETIVFARLDPITGFPDHENLTTVKGSPARAVLEAGDYLVVAHKPGYGFHEVFRHVPDRSETSHEKWYTHQRWKKLPHEANDENWGVELPTVKIPPVDVSEGMQVFDGADSFRVGSPEVLISPPHYRRVRSFYLDSAEVSAGDFRRVGKFMQEDALDRLLPDDHPMSFISYDTAVAYAEHIGKRLPDEAEYEFAATGGGVLELPWRQKRETINEWVYGAIGVAGHDRLAMHPSVLGLYSNVAEWTASRWAYYPTHRSRDLPNLPQDCYIVRGGPYRDEFDEGDMNTGPRHRVGIPRNTRRANIGFRCARSVQPRLQPNDFITLPSGRRK
jgi:formylglycine-generating enzyme required for sulfatase activity